MSRTFYNPQIIRKLNIAFMSLFKDIQVANYEADGTLINYRDVPLHFGHKGKYISIAKKKDAQFFSTYLPRIAVTITGINPALEYAKGGHLTPIYKYHTTSSDSMHELYGGTPFSVYYQVSILSEKLSHATQILEQIIPYFAPSVNVKINEFDFLPGFTREIPIKLESISPIFPEDTPETELQHIQFDLDFESIAYMYRPTLSSSIIKDINIQMIDSSLIPTITGQDLSSYAYVVSGESEDYIEITDEWIDEI